MARSSTIPSSANPITNSVTPTFVSQFVPSVSSNADIFLICCFKVGRSIPTRIDCTGRAASTRAAAVEGKFTGCAVGCAGLGSTGALGGGGAAPGGFAGAPGNVGSGGLGSSGFAGSAGFAGSNGFAGSIGFATSAGFSCTTDGGVGCATPAGGGKTTGGIGLG